MDNHLRPRPQILLVDDDPADRDLFQTAFAESGVDCHVVVAWNGTIALDLLHAMIERDLPALVIVDMNMPGMSGRALLEALSDDPALCELPVVVLTAAPLPVDRDACLRLGAVDYLSKPAHFAEIKALAQRLAGRLSMATAE